jgi:GNAT superfamily N-acetyltransferase
MMTAENIDYRLATIEDLESLVALRAAFLVESAGAEPTDPRILEALVEALRRYFASALPTGEFMGYLAIVEGRVVGTSGMVIHRRPPGPSNLTGCEAYVMNMYTLPAWRGRGIATALVRKLIDLAAKKGCKRLSLHATPLGRPIYAKAGFVPAESEMRLDLRRQHKD